VQDERQHLMTLLETKTSLETEKQELLDQLFTRDAEELMKAYESGNKEGYVTIFACRTRWQLEQLNKVWQHRLGTECLLILPE
jgi:2-keto-3-deoxy-galactonokinase